MTTPLPAATDYTAAANQAAKKTFMTSVRTFLAELLGTAGHGFDGALLAAPRRVTFAGTADAITATLSPAPSAYVTGMRVTGLLPGANTITAPTLNLNALGVKTIKKRSEAGAKVALVAGDYNGTLPFEFEYNGTDFMVLNVLLPGASGLFDKSDPTTVVFTKTAAATVSIKAGTRVWQRSGSVRAFVADTAITMPSLSGGTDYAIYVCDDGTIRADSSASAPSGYTTGNSRKIGGFHYGLVAPGTTVAGGSFATTGNGMIWTQGAVDNIAGINLYSLWDLKWRPAQADPRGMALVNSCVWVDIYLCSTDTDANGTSKYNTNIASGTVLPKIPVVHGGNGTTTYPSLNWWVANELAQAQKKRLMIETEFVTAAFGVTENQSIDATSSTYPTTQRNAGYTSKWGLEEASGHHWTWGQDSNFYGEAASPSGSWKQVNGNTGAAGSERGQTYTFGTYGLVRAMFGGTRAGGALSGSRASYWSNYPWGSGWNVGLRAACDHLQLG